LVVNKLNPNLFKGKSNTKKIVGVALAALLGMGVGRRLGEEILGGPYEKINKH
jgi:hypothetical protein